MTNYTNEEYDSGTQNWSALWNNGRQYFANNGGLLEFDGSSWFTHPTPNNTILRSLASAGLDTIYIGAQGELGYFAPDNKGQLTYNSIIPTLSEENQNLEEIWDMALVNGRLYVKTKFNQILIYTANRQVTIGEDAFITKLGKAGGEIWYHVIDKGLYRIVDDISEVIPGGEILKTFTVKGFIKGNHEEVYILTLKNGIWVYRDGLFQKWNSNAQDYLSKNRINCGTITRKGELIIGTTIGGMVIIHPNGQARLLLTKKNGLQNNAISTVELSPNNELWIGTANGIDRINLNASKETFYPDGELEGGVYDIEKYNGKMFFCTSNGVYYIEEKEYYNPFTTIAYKMIAGTEGQAWGFDLIDGELFCAHNSGGFIINKDLSLDFLQRPSGAWKFVSLDKSTIAIGGYNGVSILKRKAGKWTIDHEVPGLDLSSRIMLLDKYHNLWVSHPYKNVYKIHFNDDYTSSSIKAYDKSDGFNDDNRNYVFKVNGQCIVTNETGAYEYEAETDKFKVAKELSQIYEPGVHLKSIINDNDNLWTISSAGTDRLDISEDGKLLQSNFGHVRDANYIGGFENLFPVNDSLILTCSDKGVHQITAAALSSSLAAPTLTSVRLIARKDSILYGGHGSMSIPELEENENALSFKFSSLNTLEKNIKFFQYMLEGTDDGWSEWTLGNTKEYNNLKHGTYTFHVRVINEDRTESPVSSYTFKILTPWYKTALAKITYLVIGLLSLLSLFLIPNKKLQETTAQLEAEIQIAEAKTEKIKQEADAENERLKREAEAENERLKREAEADAEKQKQEADIELEKIRREKLQNEIEFKNKELAMSTMILLQKNETIKAIRGEIEQAEKNIKDPKAKKELKKVVSLLRSDDRMEDDWNNFSIHFDQTHHQFLKRIKEAYPKLTPKDQKLCAYLRMNLTTKEIAPLLKISVRGVEISRYRLRKKIALDKDHNLNEFMMGF